MRAALLEAVYRLVRRRAWWVLLLAAVLSTTALVYIRDLPMRSSFLALLPSDHPLLLEFQEREEIFTKTDALSVVLALNDEELIKRLEGLKEPPAELQALLEKLKGLPEVHKDLLEEIRKNLEKLRESPQLRDFFGGLKNHLKAAAEQIRKHLQDRNPQEIVSVSFTKDIQTRRGGELLSVRDKFFLNLKDYRERLRQILPAPSEGQPTISVGVRDLITLYSQINNELKKMGTEVDLSQLRLNPLELVKRFEELKKLNESVKKEFENAPALIQTADQLVTDLLATVVEIDTEIDTVLAWPQELYLSQDGTKLLINVRPRQSSQYSLDYNRKITRSVRETLQRSELENQGLRWGLTGPYVVAAETNYQISVDMRNTTILSAIGVLLVVIFALRRFFYPVLALIVLFLALIMTLAWAKFATNGLNLVTSFLPPLILGLGIDYGINFIAHFLDGRRAGARIETALKSAILHKGGALITASLATALVLFGLMVASSPGLYEMGIIAGIGVLLALAATLLILPALIIVSHIMLRRRLLHHAPLTPREPPSSSSERIESFWRWARWPIVLSALVISSFMFNQAIHVGFRFADEDLAPQELPSRAVQQEARRDFEAGTSGLGEYFLFFAPTLDELYHVTAGLEDLKQRGFIDATYSLATFVPQGEGQQFLEGLSLNLERDLQRARAELERQSAELQLLQDLTVQIAQLKANLTQITGLVNLFGGGRPLSTVMEELQRLITQLNEIEAGIQGLEIMQTRLSDLRARLDELERRLQALLEKTTKLQQVNELLNVLPKEIQERFVTKEREFVIYAHLKHATINEPTVYQEFVKAARTFSDDYLGYPMIQESLERKMKSDFQISTILASVIILVILAVGLGWGWALLGVVPVGLGFLWMLGMMRLSGLDFNFANIIISSLLIGNGVDYAVYLLHGFLEQRCVGVVWKQTALPILGSALTTMVSFGSLLFAATPGLRAFGQSALYGIGFTTLFTLVLLPALLALFPHRTH